METTKPDTFDHPCPFCDCDISGHAVETDCFAAMMHLAYGTWAGPMVPIVPGMTWQECIDSGFDNLTEALARQLMYPKPDPIMAYCNLGPKDIPNVILITHNKFNSPAQIGPILWDFILAGRRGELRWGIFNDSGLVVVFLNVIMESPEEINITVEDEIGALLRAWLLWQIALWIEDYEAKGGMS